ncbi:hypothetical protein DH2020_044149 [Rehmannia glutinosa]|uniref:ABC transporter domain-containing protein n=1 Tax=Rehmannia glutinosa TaxID=99300 RepID=A0ABR0UHR2_REHGL
MSRVVAEDNNTASPMPVRDSVPFYDRRELEMSRAAACASPTLGQLLKCVGDVRKEVTGDETPVHQVLDMSHVDHQLIMSSIPFVLSFSHLTYSIKARRKAALPNLRFPRAADPVSGETLSPGTKTILDDVCGEARDGEIMAVMGASGSDRIEINEGYIRVRNARRSFVPHAHCRRNLMFAAEFRLPRTLSKSKKKIRVQALIDQLGLRNAAKTVIGDEGHRGVSGGERRRVSIGIDIIHDPILLFLDEPTSGLDSTSAFLLVKVLQRIAQTGSLVITSIHQPSYRILGLLDRMIFLSRGKTVYSGSPSNLPLFFSDFGHPIPDSENRTEFALDLIRELEGSPGGTKSLVEFNKSWQTLKRGNINNIIQTTIAGASNGSTINLSLKEAISASISRGKLVSGTGNGGPTNSATSMVPTFANPSWIELAVLSRRSFTNSRRMPELFGIRLAAVMVTGFILATVFWRLDNSPKGIQERLGFFAFAMSTMFYTCADALPVFLQERYIFMRETAYNAYRRSSYVLSHSLMSLPAILFMSLAFAATTFWAVGLDGSFLFYFMIIFASFWAGSSFVTFLSGVVPQVMLGYVIVVALLAYFLLFSGFFINRDRIPPYWIWFHYISLVKYPYEAVLQNEFQDPTKCFVRGIQIFDGTPLAAVPNDLKVKLLGSMSSTLGMRITSTTCVTTGADILQQQGVNDLSMWNCFWVTVAWGFFFRILFYLALLLGSKNKRR